MADKNQLSPTIHASAVLLGAKAVLIRGPSGAGKSRLAWGLLQAARRGALPFARLVADDRAYVERHNGRLLVRPTPALVGLIEIRGLGIRQLPCEPLAMVNVVLDLNADDAARHPPPGAGKTTIAGIKLPRLAIAAGWDALPVLMGWLSTQAGD